MVFNFTLHVPTLMCRNSPVHTSKSPSRSSEQILFLASVFRAHTILKGPNYQVLLMCLSVLTSLSIHSCMMCSPTINSTLMLVIKFSFYWNFWKSSAWSFRRMHFVVLKVGFITGLVYQTAVLHRASYEYCMMVMLMGVQRISAFHGCSSYQLFNKQFGLDHMFLWGGQNTGGNLKLQVWHVAVCLSEQST